MSKVSHVRILDLKKGQSSEVKRYLNLNTYFMSCRILGLIRWMNCKIYLSNSAQFLPLYSRSLIFIHTSVQNWTFPRLTTKWGVYEKSDLRNANAENMYFPLRAQFCQKTSCAQGLQETQHKHISFRLPCNDFNERDTGYLAFNLLGLWVVSLGFNNSFERKRIDQMIFESYVHNKFQKFYI